MLSASFDATGGRVVTGGADRRVRLWDAADGRELQVLEGHRGEVRARFGPRGQRLLSWSWDGTAAVWDTESGARLAVHEVTSTRSSTHASTRAASGW